MPKTRKRKTLADKKARKEPKPKVSKYAKKQQPAERKDDATQATD